MQLFISTFIVLILAKSLWMRLFRMSCFLSILQELISPKLALQYNKRLHFVLINSFIKTFLIRTAKALWSGWYQRLSLIG